jgi:hypothetical protein
MKVTYLPVKKNGVLDVGLLKKTTHTQLNGDEKLRYFGNLNISFAFV